MDEAELKLGIGGKHSSFGGLLDVISQNSIFRKSET